MKHVLLATTGESPQVVTETLFALHQEHQPWPDALYLITTSRGQSKAREGLLERGHLARLCDELGVKQPLFDNSHILVVPDANGVPVDDARSLEDHEALANFIMTQVRNLTADPQQSVHASLAGGRKTMTFYLGYAMSLLGRQQDRLSHVLVSKGYESLADFWYPSQQQGQLHDRQGAPLLTAEGKPLIASAATVTLAPIPFVRHRQSLPAILPQTGESVHFRDVVRLINLGEQPEALRLQIDLAQQLITVSDEESDQRFEFKPSLIGLAFYAMMARATCAEESDLTRPSKKRADTALLKVFLDELMPLCGLQSCADWQTGLKQLLDWSELKGQVKDNTIDALNGGIPDYWFDQRKGELRKLFEQKLPLTVSRWLSPEIIWSEDGALLEQPGSTKGGGYGIPLARKNIEIINC